MAPTMQANPAGRHWHIVNAVKTDSKMLALSTTVIED